MKISIHTLPHAEGMPLPSYATPHAAAMDLRAAIPAEEVWILDPGERRLVPTGLSMAIPEGFEGQVRPRSGLALRHGVTVLNAPGTIDSDYRGEVMVVLINHGRVPFEIRSGGTHRTASGGPGLSLGMGPRNGTRRPRRDRARRRGVRLNRPPLALFPFAIKRLPPPSNPAARGCLVVEVLLLFTNAYYFLPTPLPGLGAGATGALAAPSAGNLAS